MKERERYRTYCFSSASLHILEHRVKERLGNKTHVVPLVWRRMCKSAYVCVRVSVPGWSLLDEFFPRCSSEAQLNFLPIF